MFNTSYLVVIADNAVSKAKQGIADDHPETPRVYLRIMKSQPGRLDLNLRLSAPKAPIRLIEKVG